MGSMLLHWSPRSPFVRKVMIAAHELGVVDQLTLRRTVAAMTAPNVDLLPDNPLSKIPTLVLADGSVVIDSGLARVPLYEPDIGVTRLVTQRASRAASDQRRGRAGRTEPGICYRLWEEAANGALEAFARPEILSADLAPLLLDCAAWGVSDPTTLAFLDPPPAPALKEARMLLGDLDAL